MASCAVHLVTLQPARKLENMKHMYSQRPCFPFLSFGSFSLVSLPLPLPGKRPFGWHREGTFGCHC